MGSAVKKDRLTGNAVFTENPVASSLEGAVETKELNSSSRFAINTQIEMGIIASRTLLRDSP